VTYGTCEYTVNVFGFEIERSGRSSRHIPFEWSSDDSF
jgi:hypothetical protein